jgi:AcrR family transcriptional regulator
MLLAARVRFLAESYENVGMRNIAADTGVDVALVSRYFGSKEDLFRAVLQSFGDSPFQVDVPAAELPAYLVSLICDKAEPTSRAKVERLLIILRSASSPAAAAIIRETVHADVLDPIAALLEGERAPLRASLMLALLMGTTILRTIMSVEPLQECSEEAVRARLLRLFDTALAPD